MRIRLALCTCAVAAITGCGTSTPAPQAPAPATTSAAANVQCLTVDPAVIAGLEQGAQQGTGLKMTGKAAAVRSPEHEKVFLIAAEFTATGVTPQKGVWASNKIDGLGGLYMSVDSFAKQFTTWPDAAKTDAKIGPAGKTINEARACLK